MKLPKKGKTEKKQLHQNAETFVFYCSIQQDDIM